ncbi:MAG: cellulase family glycosylhydrolase [Nocardioides sp.]|uniref:cellulase family glycosylhydrolase n=1 Tax=Nocardioides sp. TaxID=35761 RepID=UPI00239A87E1|nr:cellulase family glycosylhydrolase [Nocardioides sp.]MDE0775258.1 cellulase family glycosylhydrolase [Nocardioides sp.]
MSRRSQLPGLRTVASATGLVLGLVAALVLSAMAMPPTGADRGAPTPGTSSSEQRADTPQQAERGRSLVVPRAGYGFSDGARLVQLSRRDLRRQLDAVARTDATWLRVPFNWSHIESQRGTYDWSQVDRVVRAARRHGLTVLANISYAPTWARAAESEPTAPPRSAKTYGRFAGAAVEHFVGKVQHWELWNEPNLASHYGGGSYHARAPETYTKLVKRAYRAIKRQDRRSTVVAGSLAAGLNNDKGFRMPTFVRRMYAAGAAKFFDAISLHPYTTESEASWKRVYGDVDDVRTLMRRRGHAERPIWFTEIGNSTSTDGPSQKEQAALLVRSLEAAASRPYVGPAILYAIRDGGSDRSVFGQNFGTLLTFDFEPKRMARVLRTRS